MSLGVLNNLSAMYAENNLNNTTNSLNTVLQQLSSGSKINSGADDAAGLSLVDGLQANSQALTQSQTNASEGVGLLTVADGALSQVTSLLNRAVTLATEASNGTLNSSQDTAANQEYQSILSEVSNIGSTTTYNGTAVFGSNTNIYTGDSSTAGASVDDLNIRTLSSSNVGDSSGAMSYSNGTSNVFVDLSKAGANAAITDSLGAVNATTTMAVSYLAKGDNGAAITATTNIAVGAGTNYANTAQGMISAINNSGLGLTASFGTAAAAGGAATATAVQANDTNSALETNSTDTGIIISGAGVGVNTTGSNGAGVVGALTVSNSTDALSGTLTIQGSDGTSHAITLGTANSTDTLANLQSTINAAGYGVTASINTASQNGQNGISQAAGTLMTFTTANSAVTVNTTSAVDTQATPGVINLVAGADAVTTVGTVISTLTTNAATDTLTGVLVLGAGTTGTAGDINLDGGTLASIFGSSNTANTATLAADDIAATVSGNVVTFKTTASLAANPSTTLATNSKFQDSAVSTGTAVVQQTATGAAAGAFGTVTLSNANDVLTGGTLTIAGTAYTLGTATGSNKTDTLADLAQTINTAALLGVSATVSQDGTTMTLSGTNATVADNQVYGTGIATTLALTDTPTAAGTANSTTLGTLSLPENSTKDGASSDVLAGTLTLGTETIKLGTSTGNAKTDTMADLAQTINQGTYGVKANLNSSGTAITFTSANSDNATASNVLPSTSSSSNPLVAATSTTILPTIAAAYDGSATAADELTFSTANNGVTSSAYYSIGVSGTIADTSTGGGTAVAGYSSDKNGTGGIATISYSDAAGVSLSSSDLSNQADAQAALTALNSAITDVAAQDGYIGAQTNTLNAVSSVLSTQQQNVVAAQNAVQATDYASATSNMSKYEILSQTGISALAQANSMSQEVTKLLQ
ncbi:MAG: flagellin [Terracidiphilus sp.]|jgi:flagellin